MIICMNGHAELPGRFHHSKIRRQEFMICRFLSARTGKPWSSNNGFWGENIHLGPLPVRLFIYVTAERDISAGTVPKLSILSIRPVFHSERVMDG